MPEGPDPAVEALQELVAVCFTFAEQRQQRVPQVHVPPSLRQLGSEPRARSRSARIPACAARARQPRLTARALRAAGAAFSLWTAVHTGTQILGAPPPAD